MRLFLSFRFTDEWFVHRVNYYLRKQPGIESYCYAEVRHFKAWSDLVARKLDACQCFVLFLGPKLGEIQKYETDLFANEHFGAGATPLVVYRCRAEEAERLPGNLRLFAGNVIQQKDYAIQQKDYPPQREPSKEGEPDEKSVRRAEFVRENIEASECAKLICERLPGHGEWVPSDGLPIGNPFDYEKDIIEEYVKERKGELASPNLYELGCPRLWPTVPFMDPPSRNPLSPEDIGSYRPGDDRIIVDTRTKYHVPLCSKEQPKNAPKAKRDPFCLEDKLFGFPEAGPRAWLKFPPDRLLRVGVVVSGGIAPGINAVIDGIVERLNLYFEPKRENPGRHKNLEIRLYRDGFRGVLHDNFEERRHPKVPVNAPAPVNLREAANRGGSVIGTSRKDDLLDVAESQIREKLLDKIVDNLHDKVDVLFVIGGDGSMRIAHAIYTKARALYGKDAFSVATIPKTMDNDILWVWQAFGFLSAVERARQGIEHLHTEVSSNPRLCVIQLFGSDSGFVVSHAALASGSCDVALIPEVPFTMRALGNHICEELGTRYRQGQKRAYGTILLAETAIPSDVEDYIDNPCFPKVCLDEAEKKAIRKFTGSPLLHADSIKKNQFHSFCACTVTAAEKDPPEQPPTTPPSWIFRQLRPEARGIIQSVGNQPWNEPAMRSAVVMALNELLKGKPWYADQEMFPEDELTPDAREVKEVLKFLERIGRNIRTHVHKEDDALSKYAKAQPDLRRLLDSLTGLPLPHGAYEIRDAFERYWATCFRKGCDRVPAAKNEDSPQEKCRGLVRQLKNDELTQQKRGRLEEKYLRETSKLMKVGEKALQQEAPDKVMTKKKAVAFLGRLEKILHQKVNRLLLDWIYKDMIKASSETRGDRRVRGQTPDELRTAGLKVVTSVLESMIRTDPKLQGIGELPDPNPHRDDFGPDQDRRPTYWDDFRVFHNEPRHLLRAIPPSVSDVIFGHRLGVLAVDNALGGYTDFMVSQWVTEYVLVPLELVILGRKRVPRRGMFWKSVLANTGQPWDLSELEAGAPGERAAATGANE